MTTTNPGGLCNLRDVGGLPTEDGRRTRPGVLYRSDVPLAGDPDPSDVPQWPPGTVLDLRAPGERQAGHPLAAAGATVHPLPVMDDVRFAGAVAASWPPADGLQAWFAALYRRWLEERPEAVAGAVAAAMRGEPPVLVHCAAGRDRTGVVVALLLRAAGVQRAAIVADYRRTEVNHARLMARLTERGALRTPRGSGLRDAQLATPEAIEQVLDHVDAHPGGLPRWLAGHGVAEPDLVAWRERLVEG
ncbi:tyrosine-protein phosphatase [Pseudonocardia nigra]|uniref:tyrosine-protein phosphatase n=1 Tax=Pseudonocardia nigra TaxID=1921578 RepID=UPI001C5D1DB0|nr:tyrosine-protein phosphatase [Pseudonocardia nigra]